MNTKKFNKNVIDMLNQTDLDSDFDTKQPVRNTKDYVTFEIVALTDEIGTIIAKSHEEAEKQFSVLFNEYIEEHEVGEGFEWYKVVDGPNGEEYMAECKEGEQHYELLCKDFYTTNDL